MNWKFAKMQACGNDYVYLDCMGKELQNPKELAIKLSDRRYGIGGDGIILVCSSRVADAKMRIFNQDGSEGRMCGNGIRCVAKFLRDYGYISGNVSVVETLSGIKKLEFLEYAEQTTIKVSMGKAMFKSKDIPTTIEGEKIVNYNLAYKNTQLKINLISMGNPHCVIFCDDINSVDLFGIGRYLNASEFFPQGVNVEFVKVNNNQNLEMRVYERGSEETLACGTGACAAAVASVLNGYFEKNRNIKVKLRGGDLDVVYTDNQVYLIGEATKVFEGYVDIRQ